MQKLSLAAESIREGVGVDKGSWFSSESERKGISGPGESQGQGSLVGCQLWGRTGSDTT